MTTQGCGDSDRGTILWLRQIVKLGAPIFFVQATIIASVVIDSVMAGSLSAKDLAVVGIGSSLYVSVFVAFFGVILALSPLVSQLYGRGLIEEIGSQVTQAAWLSLALSTIGFLVFMNGDLLVSVMNAPPDLAEGVNLYLMGCALGLPGALMFRIFYATSTAMSAPRYVLVINTCGLLFKVPLNAFFIYGYGDVVPALGGAGCAFASAIISTGSGLFAFFLLTYQKRFKILRFPRAEGPKLSKQLELLGLGIPIALTQVTEVTAFAGMAFCIARLGPINAAAHQIAANAATTLFMLPFALSLAVSILLGQSIGRQDKAGEKKIICAGVILLSCLSLVTTVLILVMKDRIASIYTSDPRVVILASALLIWVGICQWGDAFQVLFIAALRARKFTRVATLVTLVARWGVGLLGGYWLAFGPPQLGARGFWIAATLGISLAGAWLCLYYFFKFTVQTHLLLPSHRT